MKEKILEIKRELFAILSSSPDVTDDLMKEKIQMYTKQYKLTDKEGKLIHWYLKTKIPRKIEEPIIIIDTDKNDKRWYNNVEKNWKYWNRYRNYLKNEKHWNEEIIDQIHRITDEISDTQLRAGTIISPFSPRYFR